MLAQCWLQTCVTFLICTNTSDDLSSDPQVKPKTASQGSILAMDCVLWDSLCSSEVHTEDVEFVDAQYMVVSEVKEYQQVQTSHVDPTVDSDNDFEEAPLSDELVACVGLGECGA